MDENNRLEWYKFVSRGKWVRETPTRPGEYRIATRDGMAAGTRVVVMDPRTDICRPVAPWEGWWWSIPVPPMPSPGKW